MVRSLARGSCEEDTHLQVLPDLCLGLWERCMWLLKPGDIHPWAKPMILLSRLPVLALRPMEEKKTKKKTDKIDRVDNYWAKKKICQGKEGIKTHSDDTWVVRFILQNKSFVVSDIKLKGWSCLQSVRFGCSTTVCSSCSTPQLAVFFKIGASWSDIEKLDGSLFYQLTWWI